MRDQAGESISGRLGERRPGHVWQGFASDDHLWSVHLRWLHLMNGGDL